MRPAAYSAPLFAVVADGLNQAVNRVLVQPILWQATLTSLKIALGAGLLAVLLTMMLLWSSRELVLRQRRWLGQGMELTGMLILAMPGIVLATGFFLLLTDTIGIPQSAYGLVILTNALMAIPYALKVLENPMRDLAERYNPLCLSLRIQGINRLRLIELRALKRPLSQAMAFACVLSLGILAWWRYLAMSNSVRCHSTFISKLGLIAAKMVQSPRCYY